MVSWDWRIQLTCEYGQQGLGLILPGKYGQLGLENTINMWVWSAGNEGYYYQSTYRHKRPLMNSFNKTEAAVFSFRPCFLRASLSSVYYKILISRQFYRTPTSKTLQVCQEIQHNTRHCKELIHTHTIIWIVNIKIAYLNNITNPSIY